MSELKLKYKILLFLSSYTPLFLILLLKVTSQLVDNYQETEQIVIKSFLLANWVSILVLVILFLIIVFPNIILGLILKDTKRTNNPKQVKVRSVNKMNHIYMEYLISYIIPFLAFDFSDFFDMSALMLLIVTIGIIYINSDLLYININFNIRGYNLYNIIDVDDKEYMLLSKKRHINKNILLHLRDISSTQERFVLDVERKEDD
jgi:uncharacterized membrane protein YhdT